MKSDVGKLKITDKELKKITGLNDLKKLIDSKDLEKLGGKDPRRYLPANSDVIIRPSVIHALSHDTEWQRMFLTRITKNINVGKSSTIGCVSSGILMPILLVILARVFWVDEIALIAIALLGTPLMYGVLRMFSKYLLQHSEDSMNNAVIEYVNTLTPTPLGALIDEVDNYNQTVQEFVSYLDVIDQLAEAGHSIGIQDREKTIRAFQGMRADLIRALKTEKIFREHPTLQPEHFSIDFMPLKTLEFDEQAKDCERLVNEAMEIGLRVQEEMKKLSDSKSQDSI